MGAESPILAPFQQMRKHRNEPLLDDDHYTWKQLLNSWEEGRAPRIRLGLGLVLDQAFLANALSATKEQLLGIEATEPIALEVVKPPCNNHP